MTELPPSLSEHKYSDLTGLKTALMGCFRCLGMTFESESHTFFDIPLELDENDLDPDLIQMHSSSIADIPVLLILKQLREVFADFNLWGQPFKDLFPVGISDVDADSVSLRVTEHRITSLGRLLTSCRGYVGICLCNVRPGDEVFLLHGCIMPVVLRRSISCPDAYVLQGGVYIPGVMKGEALAQFQLSGERDEMITIC